MSDRVGIVVATFGGQEWIDRGKRAVASAENQTVDCFVTWVHAAADPGCSLGALRNEGTIALPEVDWLIFLDGDDELAPDYVERMLEGEGDIRQPGTIGVREDGVEDDHAVLIPEKSLIDGNFIVIGAMIDAKKFFEVNGFGDYPIIEDWDLWLRMYCAGATIGKCPEAVYRVTVREGSRNTTDQTKIYKLIRSKNYDAFIARGSNV